MFILEVIQLRQYVGRRVPKHRHLYSACLIIENNRDQLFSVFFLFRKKLTCVIEFYSVKFIA